MNFQYPTELEDHIRLPNGEELRIRPLRRGDDRSIRQLYGNLSADTRYLRFFSPLPQLPDSVLQLITGVDYCGRMGLIAEMKAPDGVQVVALGSFAAVNDNTAEVALVVADRWQHRGIGTALAARLLRAAEARGFDRFVAHIIHGNAVIRRLLDRATVVVSIKTQSAVSEVLFVRRRCTASGG